MILFDVNIWVYAFRTDSPLHSVSYQLMQGTLSKHEPFLFLPSVATSFLRLVTNHLIFKTPSTIEEAWNFIDVLEEHPASFHAEIDAMTLGIFKHLCMVSAAKGNDIPDALLAASAIRHNAILYSSDKKFARYPGLQFKKVEG